MPHHDDMMRIGIENGWWEEYNERGPIRVWRVYLFGDDALVSVLRTIDNYDLKKLPRPRYLSQLLSAIGFYRSVSEARASGHGSELAEGDLLLRLPLPHGGKGQERFIISVSERMPT